MSRKAGETNDKKYAELRKFAASYLRGVGEYGTPLLEATEFEKCEFIGFNYCRTCKDKEGKGVHFFLDDYQFNRIWNQPNKYLPILQQFRYVMTPDFSMYTDFPKIIQSTTITENTGSERIYRKMEWM